MVVQPASQQQDVVYSILPSERCASVQRTGQPAIDVAGYGELVYWLEKDITIELQRRRRDLLFLHAAALEFQGRAFLLAADAGSGKSTTTWALLHHGFAYLSDELSPIDPQTLEVFAYPHAICLKQAPPAPYGLPMTAMDLGRTLHIPVEALPAPPGEVPRPLGGIFLIRHDPGLESPRLRSLSTAEAAARIYPTALNVLAHPDRGLAVVLDLVRSVPCFALATAGLAATSAVIRSAIEQAAPCSSSSS